MNGFKIESKPASDPTAEDADDNVFLIKSLPYSKKVQFTIEGKVAL